MKLSGRLVARSCAALAAAAFGAAIWLHARGESVPAPLDLVWIQPDAGEAGAALPRLEELGLLPGDRLRLVGKSPQGWKAQTRIPGAEPGSWADIPSLASMYGDALPQAKLVWVCRSDRDHADFPARARGASLHFLPAIAEDPPGWEFLGVAVPAKIRAGRPFPLRWEAGTVRGASGKVRVWIDEALAGEKSFSVLAGRERVEIPVTVTAGTHALRLEAVEGLAAGRPRAISTTIEALPSPRLRVLGEENEVSRRLLTQGFRREEEGGAATPAPPLPPELAPDLVIVTRPLSSSELEALEQETRAGAGVLLFGGDLAAGRDGTSWPSWLPGKIRESPHGSASGPRQDLAGAEPSAPTPPAAPVGEIQPGSRETREAGVLALMLVLDKSGSMAGEKLERTLDAAVATAKTLDPKDWLGILAFDREVSELLPLGPVAEAGDLRKRLDAVDAGGGTRIFPALKRGAEQLVAAPASIRHLILLTDGATEDKVAKDAPYFEFMTEQARRGLTLTAVGIRGGDYDSEFLSNLAVWGKGRFYPVDSDRIPQIFTLEARRVRSGAGVPQPAKPSDVKGDLRVRAGDPHPSLEGVDWEKPQPAPALGASNELLPEPWASVPLTVGGKPLLAIAHAGSGRVALWASWGAGPAVAEWMSDPRAGQFWTQLAEYLRRRDAGESEPGAFRREGADLEGRLRTREERLREMGQMSARCGGEMLLEAQDLSSALTRATRSAAPASLPWIALLGAALALVGMISLTRSES